MVAIIYIQDIRYCPFLGRYTQALRSMDIPFDLIWWERWDTAPQTPLPDAAEGAQNCFVFRRESRMARHPAQKVGDFAAFSRYVRQVLGKKRYDQLIVLTTMSAIVLYDLLTGAYKGRYIYDIRDYSYEWLVPFRTMQGRLAKNSGFTCISSEGFLDFLPGGYAYTLTDNFLNSDVDAAQGVSFRKKLEWEPLTLSYIGFIRYFKENRKILDKLVEDPRFRLCYHGTGADYQALLDYQAGHNSQRLKVTGYFDYGKEKAQLCLQADIINNFYPHTLEIQRLATTNKTYDGIIFRRPQLVSAGTYSQKLVEKWGVGWALDINQPDFADRLYDQYHSLDEEIFNQNAARALAVIRARDAKYQEKIERFLFSGKGCE